MYAWEKHFSNLISEARKYDKYFIFNFDQKVNSFLCGV
jgi:hypothetical protein